MDILEALGGWRNINQEKLKQIKVDNAPLYDAITKAINLLAKKYGGEDIIIQKPIDVVAENVQPRELSYLEQSILLSQRRGTETEFLEIFKSVEKIALQKYQLNISYLSIREQLEAIEKLVEDGYLNKIVSSAYGDSYILTEKGENAVNKIVSYVGQPPQETPSDEDLKLEILQRMADYYDGNEFQSLSQDDIIINAVKHEFDISSNKYFGLVVKLLQDGFVEKDPNGPTDSISLTMEGYDKSQGWYEENKPAEETPSENLDVSYLRMIQKLREKKSDWVTIEDIVAEKGVPNMLTKQEYIDAQKTILDDLEKRDLVSRVRDEYTITPLAKKLLALNPEVETPIEQPAQAQLTDLLISILEAVEEASSRKVGDDFVKIVDIWPYVMGNMPTNYAVYQINLTTPSLQQDLAILYMGGYLEFAQSGLEARDYKYMLSRKGIEFLSAKNTLNDLNDFVDAQPTQPIVQTTPPTTNTNLRPSPTDSATMYATGTKMFGNDGNEWRVTENKNGVKRWVKVGGIPSELPDPTNLDVGSFVYGKLGKIYRVWLNENNKKELVEVESIANPKAVETPISEIDEDEVDLDILEQQLNDDSLEFDITDEDLDNLEF